MRRIPGRIRAKCGYTLIELVVATAMVAILTTGVAAIIVPSVNIYVRSTELSRAKLIATGVAEELSSKLAYAGAVTLKAETDGAYTEAECVDGVYGQLRILASEGRLQILSAGENISFDEKYYMKCNLGLTFTKDAEDMLTAHIRILNSEGLTLFGIDRVIRTLNASVITPQ